MAGELAVMTRADAVEQVLIQGDLSKLTVEQRNEYYMRLCHSVGLNPLTQPFAYMTLQGKLTLYAKRDATDQLRSIHDISVVESVESERADVLIVTTKVQNAKGRTDIGRGAVSIGSLKGEALANAIMKAETKAKRRATLSICGLGLLDELELETIPGALPPQEAAGGESTPLAPTRQRRSDPNSSASRKKDGTWDWVLDCIAAITSDADAGALLAEERYATMPLAWREEAEGLINERLEHIAAIAPFLSQIDDLKTVAALDDWANEYKAELDKLPVAAYNEVLGVWKAKARAVSARG